MNVEGAESIGLSHVTSWFETPVVGETAWLKKELTRGSSSTLQESGKSRNSSRCVTAAVKAESPLVSAGRWSAVFAAGML